MPSTSETLLKNPRAYIAEADLAPSDAPLPDPGADAPAVDAAQDGVDPKGTSPDPSGLFDPLKNLAKNNLPLVQHIVNLRKAYLEDPHLGSKEATTSMAAIMHHLWRKDEKAAYYFGRVTFEPNIDSFIALFDDIGNQPLGPYLGIKSLNDIPKGSGGDGEIGDDLGTQLNTPADGNPSGPANAPAMGDGPPTPQQPGAPEAPKLPRL